jgi:hypothetical protein
MDEIFACVRNSHCHYTLWKNIWLDKNLKRAVQKTKRVKIVPVCLRKTLVQFNHCQFRASSSLVPVGILKFSSYKIKSEYSDYTSSKFDQFLVYPFLVGFKMTKKIFYKL